MQVFIQPLRRFGIFLFLFVVCIGIRVVCNTYSTPLAQQNSISVINSAYNGEVAVAPNSIAAVFGDFKTLNNQVYVASTDPFPTELGGVSLKVNGVDAPLVFTSPFQVNVLVPPSTSLGTASVVVTNVDKSMRSGTMKVEQYVPG